MRRFQATMAHEAIVWNTRRNAPYVNSTSSELQDGLRAYAARQSSIRLLRQHNANQRWRLDSPAPTFLTPVDQAANEIVLFQTPYHRKRKAKDAADPPEPLGESSDMHDFDSDSE